jgi:hypothetical protein
MPNLTLYSKKKDNQRAGTLFSYLYLDLKEIGLGNQVKSLVKRAIEKGYLLKKRETSDERKVILCLTDRGKEILHRNTCLDEQKLNTILSQLTKEEKDTIGTALKLLSECAKQCL